MLPLTLLAGQKLANLLTGSDALQNTVSSLAESYDSSVPPLPSVQIVLSSASPDIGDKDLQLTYPRVCIYSAALKNTHTEKFRSLSGTIGTIAEIWASGNLMSDADRWIHYYVEATTSILRQNIGDWGDGFFFSGAYDVQLQSPKAGGLGYVVSAKVTCSLNVSQS